MATKEELLAEINVQAPSLSSVRKAEMADAAYVLSIKEPDTVANVVARTLTLLATPVPNDGRS